MKLTSLTIALGALLVQGILHGTLSYAESELEQRCIPGEVVLSTSTVPVLKQEAVERLEIAIQDEVAVSEDIEHAVKIETGSQSDSGPVACSKLQRYTRGEKLSRKKRGKLLPVREVGCSCNVVLSTNLLPNDPNFSSLWSMNHTSSADINVTSAWDRTTGSSEVVVAVIDTGVDYNHTDLAANIWTNPGEIANNGIDDDGNGYIDDVHGLNAITNSGNPMDDQYHGTHCAGTIGGQGNNGTGVAGVSWNVKIIPVKFLTSTGSGNLFDGIKGIDYVTNLKKRGIPIVASSNSWGMLTSSFFSPLYDAIARAREAGVLFIAAAGNDANNNDGSSKGYPGSFNLDNIISVAALDPSGALASFSNYGAGSVHIGAPGVSILSTTPGNQYQYLSGTSMAAPHVSGAAALLKAFRSDLTWQQIRQAIVNAGHTMSSLQGKTTSGKELDVGNMFTYASASFPDTRPTATPIVTPTPTRTPTPTFTPTITPTPTPTPTPGNYVMRGSVVTSDGHPVSGAQVVLTLGSETYVRFSSSSGTFAFPAIRGGVAYSLAVTKSGLSFQPIAGAFDRDMNVTVYASQSSYNLSGKVIRKDSMNPVGGIEITFSDGITTNTVTTNSSGTFSFTAPYGANYSITARSNNYLFDREKWQGTIYGNVSRLIGAVEN